MKIDSHQHFWHYSPETHPWINDQMHILKRDYLPPDLQIEMAKTGFDGCVAVQASQSEAETTFLLELAERYTFIRGVVGWVDLRAENIEDRLAHFSGFDKLCGVRHVLHDEPDEQFILGKDFMRGIGFLRRLNLTYDILIFPNHLPYAIQFVSQFPDQPFVIDHIAKPYIKDGRIDDWAREIRNIATFPNVHCKLSGMVTEADLRNWQPSDFTPYLDIVLNAFGADRLMIGSDWPVCRLAGEYPAVMKIVENYISQLSQNEQTAILGKNAQEFYQMQL